MDTIDRTSEWQYSSFENKKAEDVGQIIVGGKQRLDGDNQEEEK